jgi:pimeloyl-ACP methyl ester carboxylesterase
MTLLNIAEAGAGRPALILHGGGGPVTVAPIAEHLSATMRTITPTHPGWNGTRRPDWFTGVDDYAMAYLNLLADNDLRDVLVIGSSLGGWIGAEMAVRDLGGRISALVLVNATGVEVPGQSIVDFFGLDARGVAEHSFHDPDRFYVDPATVPPEQAAVRAANMATMRLVFGTMYDPKLLRRLARVRIPVLAVWGDSDRIVTPAYGRAYAAAFGNGRFALVRDAGHLPQIEQPAATFALIDELAKGAPQ